MMNMVMKVLLAATFAASTLAVKTDSSITAVPNALAQTSAFAEATEVDRKGDAGDINPYKGTPNSEPYYAYSRGFYDGYTNARAT